MTLKKSLHRASAIALALCIARGALAAGFMYDCDIDPSARSHGWVSPKIAIVLPGDASVSVVDALTLTFLDAPVPGRILSESDRRLVVKWTLDDVKADSGRSFAHFDYRASISKPSGRIDLMARPRTFETELHSVGNCTKRTE